MTSSVLNDSLRRYSGGSSLQEEKRVEKRGAELEPDLPADTRTEKEKNGDERDEHVSTGLIVINKNESDCWRHRLQRSMADVQSVTAEFSLKLEPQLMHVSKLVADELRQIESKESELGKRFQLQIDEYKQAKQQHKALEKAHGEHIENTNILSEDFQGISEELGQAKKKMDGKASICTDATPLIEIRSSIQCLKKENKELGVRIGILDYELSQARIPQAHSPRDLHESDDEHSSGEE